MIWERVPKYRYCGFKKLQFRDYDALANFNDGRKASLENFKNINIEPGYYITSSSMNIKRRRSAAYQHLLYAQKARKIIRAQRKRKGNKNKNKEGLVYKAGGF